MTRTPWGPSETLRSRRLPPGPGLPPAEVAANQRQRLYGATVAVVAEHGYEATRVADLLRISGVSRNAFYRLFDSKEDCVLSTIEQVIELGGAALSEAYSDAAELPWDQRLRRVIDQLVAMASDQPAASHLCLVDAYAVGPSGLERVEQIDRRVAHAVGRALRDSPARAGLPDELVSAIVAGLRKVVHTRLLHGRERELSELAPQLLDWALVYRKPDPPLRRPRKAPPLPPPPTPADAETPRERILIAATELAAEHGYAGVTITDIARHAAVSLTTFYAEFQGKDDALVAALHHNVRLTVEAVMPAYSSARDWPHAVGAALHAFLGYLANRPAQVRLGAEANGGAQQAILRRDEMLIGAQEFLAEGYTRYPDTSPVAGEAIGAAINELLYRRLAARGAASLYGIAPTAAFIALAPFVGVEKAVEVANDSSGTCCQHAKMV